MTDYAVYYFSESVIVVVSESLIGIAMVGLNLSDHFAAVELDIGDTECYVLLLSFHRTNRLL